MAEITLTYDQAHQTWCAELEAFQTLRTSGFDLEHAAAAMGIRVVTAVRYQRLIDRLTALKTSAAPGPDRPEAADPAQPTGKDYAP